MSGDWIKMRGNLWDDPRVARLCDITDQPEAMVVGALYWLWATADQHTEDGIMPGLTLRSIDRKTGLPGFGQALCDIGWLADHTEGVRIVGFEEHNGASAKKRCQTAKRVAAFKAGNAQDTPEQPEGNAASVTEALAVRDLEIEKSREEEKDISKASPSHPPAKAGGKKTPSVPCPFDSLVDAYHEALPALPRVLLRDGPTWEDRKKSMREVWAWVLSSRKSDGTPRAHNGDEAMAWFRGYFQRVNDNEWLMGRTAKSEQHQNWRCDLDFLLSKKGLKAVIEKTREAA